KRVIIVLEDMSGQRTLAIAADPEETTRLAQELARGPQGEHPILDFVDRMFQRFHLAPTCVVLEYVPGEGLASAVPFRLLGCDEDFSCYPADSLALAIRTKVPIYVSADVFSYVNPFPSSPDESEAMTEWLERVNPADFCQESSSGP